MKKFLLKLFVVGAVLQGCGEQEIGYLNTEDAKYVPDSVIFKAVLNPEVPEDAERIRFEVPFQSQGLQGVQGTLPLAYSIRRIDAISGYTEAWEQFRLTGKAQVELPFNHTVPPGRYVFSIEVTNEGHSKVLEKVLTVILK